MYVPPSKHMIYNLSFGWHTLYCTTIVLKFPMDAPFVVKANYYSPFLAPLALLVAPLLVLYLPGYGTRENLKSTRTVPLFFENPVSSTRFPPGTFCTDPGDPARENTTAQPLLLKT